MTTRPQPLARRIHVTCLTTLVSAVLLAGCNRVLPTEPEDQFSALPPLEAPQSAASTAESASTSTRTRSRPARVTPSAAPVVPAASPSPTMTTDCDGPCDGILRVPPDSDVAAAIFAARDRVRDAVARGEIKAKKKVSDWNVTPRIEWKACFFFVDNGYYYDSNGNRITGGCAAGMTDYNSKKIVITTKVPSRTLALVKWESTNYYLYLIGRKDLADRWQ